MYWPKVSVKK
jgi:hypothetical protein